MSNQTQASVIKSRVHAVHSRKQRRAFGSGLLALCRWGIPLFFIGMLIDWLIYLPPIGRAAILLVVVCVSFYKAWRHGWRHLEAFNATRTALEIEARHGKMESLLVTALQLQVAGPTPGTSTALWEQAQRNAEDAAKEVEPRKIVDFGALRIPIRVALALAIGVLAFALLKGPILSVGLARIFAPWTQTAYPTNTKLDLGEADLVVKEGDSAQIVFGVSGVVPEKAKLYLRTGESGSREIEIEIVGDKGEYTIASASRDFSYRIKAGDARSEWHQVRVISAPKIEGVQVELEFPAYLERQTETVEALTLTVPEETRLYWQLTLDRPIRDAVLHRDGVDPLPLEVSGGGRQLVIDEVVEASRGYSFSWVEKEHGFDFESPRYYLQVASDQPPQVELTSPDSNLDALLGRQLDLAVRARDDHGIGSTTITYRVNLRPEKTVTLESPVKNGEGEQVLSWDYREVISDLKIGDTVSFVVEVADKYPEPDGPHTARSETRRITFLSREEYLEQIEKKRDRLLSRVRTSYRQERAAHELVRKLDPNDDSFLQTCQLEAIRQEMLREQLKVIAREVQELLDDLKANNVTDAVEGEVLVQIRKDLETIADERIAKAASLLREQAGVAANGDADPTLAIKVVNQAARELAGLVLQRGIDYAREVFARESHMLAIEQATVRLLTMQKLDEADAKSALAERQEELATWTDELIVSLREGMRYDKRPISVLGLTRRLKELRSSGVEDKMKQAAGLIREGKVDEATALHAEVMVTLSKAEFSMRTGAEFAAVMKFRGQLDELIAAQQALRTSCEAMSSDEFNNGVDDLVTTQAQLRAALVPAVLPPVPASRAKLFDNTLPELPPVSERRTASEYAMNEALVSLQSGEQKQAIEKQLVVEKELAALSSILQEATVELSLNTQGLNSLVSTAAERIAQLEDYEARQIVLLEQTEEAALDEVKSEPLAEPQQFLSEEIADFREGLQEGVEKDKDALPLVSRLDQLAGVLADATKALKENRPEDALEFQEVAADHLAIALELALNQGGRLGLLQDMYTFQRSVGNANKWMIDIVSEQNDLIADTEKATPENGKDLIPVINNLRQCLKDIAPVLDLVAGRLDAGTPLVFAETDLEDATFAIEDEDFLDALDAQEVAAESLEEVQILVRAVQEQTGYLAEIVEFLHASQADVALTAFRLEQIRLQIEDAEGKIQAELVTEFGAIQSDAEDLGQQLVKATGMENHKDAAEQISEAYELLKSGDGAAATEQMELAEATLLENAEELYLIITMLHGLPGIEVLSTAPEELVLLLEVLGFTTDQRYLSRETEVAKDEGLAALGKRQSKVAKAIGKALRLDPPNPLLVSANESIAAADTAMQASDKAIVRKHQEAADTALRHFIIEQALILETAAAGSAPSEDPVLTENETDDLYESTASFVSDFVSGEAPKDKRTEWEVLGARNRAALNQNFARELPLEYRGVLKNYYERVAK